MLTTTNAKQETTTSAYDTDGRLQSVTGPVAGAGTTYTYDGYGRVRTVTGPDGYVATTDYDLLEPSAWNTGGTPGIRRRPRRRTRSGR